MLDMIKHKNNASCLTCCVQRTLVHTMDPVVDQTESLCHVVCRANSRASVTPGLLQEAKSVVGLHHILADPSQTPGDGNVEQENLNQ